MRRARRSAFAALMTAAQVVVAGCSSSGPSAAVATPPPVPTTVPAPDAASSTTATAVPSTTGGPAGSGTVTVSASRAQLPIPISRPAVAVSGPRILVLGGLTTGDTSTDAVFQIDVASATVTRMAPLPARVHDAAATGLGDGALVFAGGSSGITDGVQRWSPTGSSTGDHLPERRADLVATRVGDRSIVLGGTNGTTLDTQVLATTDGRSFTGLGPLAQGVRYPAVATVGSTVWLFGGETQATEGGKVVRTDVVQTFDVATGRGQVVGHLAEPRSHAMAFALGARVYLAGGRTGKGAVATVEQVDTTTGFRLQPAGSLPGPLSDSGVAVVGSTAWLIGGEVKGATDPQRSVLVVTG